MQMVNKSEMSYEDSLPQNVSGLNTTLSAYIYFPQDHMIPPHIDSLLVIGVNTFPNLMALLTGQNQSAAEETCKPKQVGGLDNCNFIWKEFHKQSYYTAYDEDTSAMSTFNYSKKGFQEPPPDYYFRPMSLAIEKHLTYNKKAGIKYCIGNRQYVNPKTTPEAIFAATIKCDPSSNSIKSHSRRRRIFAPGTRNPVVTITGEANAIVKAQILIEQNINEIKIKPAWQIILPAKNLNKKCNKNEKMPNVMPSQHN
ncbi:hypothetical protein GQX74_009686 [Glossina fuscipes]|nr:hypothetical protein GQX74_009686 [Glossina fuscipes]